MNFFDAQDRARKKTRLLLVLFAISVIVMTLALSLTISFCVYLYYLYEFMDISGGDAVSFFNWLNPSIFGAMAAFTFAVVGYFSYRGFNQLFDGGSAVLRQSGLKRIKISSEDEDEVLGVRIVSEMALAAGCPVPELFIIREGGINVFSAGWEPSDAAIAITEGALKHLRRDELQAMFAHEFSHILNGDMRLNFIMSGLLEGLFKFFELGIRLLEGGYDPDTTRTSRYGYYGRGSGNIILLYVAAMMIMAVGGMGYFMGRWIQAAMTRQQSLEADAAAVQFTRDKGSVISLLEKMGSSYLNTYLLTSRFERFSHAFIGEAGKRNFLSAHPPLIKRIKAIDPQHEIQLKALKIDASAPHVDHLADARVEAVKPIFMWTALGLGLSQSMAAENPGEESDVFDADAWNTTLPEHRTWTESARASKATVLALACAGDDQELDSQLKQLKPRIDRDVYDLVETRLSQIQQMDPRSRIAVLELCLVSLKSLSKVQYEAFRTALNILFNTDFQLDHDEFVIQRLIISRLDKHFGLSRPQYKVLRVLGDVRQESALLISLIAHTEHPDDLAQTAFDAGIRSIGATGLKIVDRKQVRLKHVHAALDLLSELPASLKRRLLTASASTIALDKKVTLKGFELLGVLATSLEMPMPVLGSEHLSEEE